MSSSKRASAAGVNLVRGLAIALVAAAAGCSADVTRFRLGFDTSTAPPSFVPTGYGDPTKTPVQPLGLPEKPPAGPLPEYRPPGRDYTPKPASLPPASAPPPFLLPEAKDPVTPVPPAATVEVQPGDTLHGIARRHGVTVGAIKDLNSLRSETLRPGQRLVLPATAKDAGPLAKAPSALTDGKPKLAPVAEPPPRVVHVPSRVVSTVPIGPKADPAQKTAKRSDVATDAMPPPAAAISKFRWPARGKVIVAFGLQSDGSKSEGISLAVPLGTDVHAAESGRVHYASDGLKGYGKIVLIRHEPDWTTAYAYLDQILVKPGEVVKRGQVIAKAGKTGPVTQPQLRFEIRKDSVPVDPLPHLPN